MSKLESAFQKQLIDKLRLLFPDCIILKNDPTYLQGVPDLLILWNSHWATLEVKRSSKEKPRPNQPYYVQRMNDMSFSAFVFPENEEQVLNALQRAFTTGR